MDALARHLRTAWRAERIVAEIRLANALRRAGLAAVAIVLALFALAMLNVAAFLGLRDVAGDAWAALAVGGADLALAGIALALATIGRTDRELALAIELRSAALAAAAADVRGLGDAAAGVRRVVRLLRHGPLGAGLSILGSIALAALLRGRGKPTA